MNKKNFYIYSVILFVVFIIMVSSAGFFKIGILSDTFSDSYTAVNSSAVDKITNNLEYIDSYRYRPVLFLTLNGLVNIKNLLGISYDNFLFFNIVNIFLYLLIALISAVIVLRISGNVKLSLITEAVVLFYPNNLHNLCWSAAYFEMLCGILFLLALPFLLKYLADGTARLLVFSNVLFVLALLTKEIAITFPLFCLVIFYIMFGKSFLRKFRAVFISQFSILLIYFIAKTFLSMGIPVVSGKYFESGFLVNTVQVIYKSIIALFVPLDFSVLRISVNSLDIFLIVYILLLLVLLIMVIVNLVRQKQINILLLTTSSFLILISPYIYAGYIRPQLILLPFISVVIMIFSFIKIKLKLISYIFIPIFIFWIVWGFGVIGGWQSAYSEGKARIDNVLKTDFNFGKKVVIIGNPTRLQQYFMYDNIMFPYNYFKYQNFIIKDTISDLIRTVALDKESLNSDLKENNTGSGEYEISCTGKTQFFYLGGDEKQISKNNGFKNSLMAVDFLEFNSLNKPVKIKVKILTDNSEVFIFQKSNLLKLN